jgi:hypothetical protein
MSSLRVFNCVFDQIPEPTKLLYQPQRASDSAGILEQSMGAWNRERIGLSYRPAGLHKLVE